MTRRVKQPPSAAALARRVGQSIVTIPDFGEWLCAVANERTWHRLVARLAREGPTPWLSNGSIVALEEPIRRALQPHADQLAAFNKVGDAWNDNANVERDAAYLVGVEVGRRLGGAR